MENFVENYKDHAIYRKRSKKGFTIFRVLDLKFSCTAYIVISETVDQVKAFLDEEKEV